MIDFDGRSWRSWRPQKARVLPDGFNAGWCEPRCFTSDRILNLMKIDRTEPGWFSVQFSVSTKFCVPRIPNPATPTQKSMAGVFVTRWSVEILRFTELTQSLTHLMRQKSVKVQSRAGRSDVFGFPFSDNSVRASRMSFMASRSISCCVWHG